MRHKLFPMLDGPSIPWDTARVILALYEKLYGEDYQPLKVIASRGGFGWAEVPHFYDKVERKYGQKVLLQIIKDAEEKNHIQAVKE